MNVDSHRARPFVVSRFDDPSDSCGTTLAPNEVHVWRRYLGVQFKEQEYYRLLLSPDETARAQRFRFESDRNNFVVARGTLRELLGRYLTIPPKELRFSYSTFGRPSVADLSATTAFDFNVSHSGEVALMAFSIGRHIGIDVEKVRQDFTTGEIADRFFSFAECTALRGLSEDQRHAAFFRCWTRKEAFIKALGEGLSHPLDRFDVSLDPNTPAALLATRPDSNEAQRWELSDIELPGDYVAALAVSKSL
ncbi:MAG: 4'-phosphopantetheinyl transferase superfamily protein [Candidatus Korobacteraceae bacterium]